MAPEDKGEAQVGSRYTARWYGFPYEADAEIWLSGDGKTVSKLLRHYDSSRWQFPFPTALLVYNLDPASAKEPAGVGLPD